MLGRAKLPKLAQTLSRDKELKHPQPVKKGEMDSIHQLLFWFLIKNIIPRGQCRNQADAMDQCFTDLMYKGEQNNLPVIMIKHIAQIADTTQEHDLGYGFLLTKVFEFFGVKLKKRVEAQVIGEIGSSTLMRCGYSLVPGTAHKAEQEARTPVPPVPHGISSKPTLDRLQAEITEVKEVLATEKELSTKRHEDLLALLATLNSKLTPPAP